MKRKLELDEKELFEQNKHLRRKVAQLTKQVSKLRKKIHSRCYDLDEEDEELDPHPLMTAPIPPQYLCEECGKAGKIINFETPTDIRVFFFCGECDHRQKLEFVKKENNDGTLDPHRQHRSNRNRPED